MLGLTTIALASLFQCKNFHSILFLNALELSGVRITARGDSPKTDGIHIGYSSRIKIADSVISIGDDCVSIGPGSKDIKIVGIYCKPSHGFRVGSFGRYPNEADVTGLSVRGCTMVGTQNGVRIKTWASGIKSNAYNLSFDDITIKDVQSRIIIDQEYRPGGGCSKQLGSNVQIKDVSFTKILGASASQVAVNLVCNPNVPCQNITLENIDLVYTGREGPVKSYYAHVKGDARGVQVSQSCILAQAISEASFFFFPSLDRLDKGESSVFRQERCWVELDCFSLSAFVFLQI
ncbi:exopolygalacturonase-like [Rhodamnia argentea]|uniref:Exopolygalacturonase-like n=1 Tax=Rhodamnia argentea TaxID=178133 RepID=A0A8B8NLW0_9MYRT|nr:exopolygalacturonase-like [Rhodamnia argentea]